jgi:dTDP-4-dehydrorhamnose 3,5-epimerase
MEARETTLPDALLIVTTVHGDERGFFQETYRRERFESFGLTQEFVQHNHSRSSRGVLRGMHLQIGEGISKLVRCVRGEIVDVIVDVRRDSPTYGRWEAFTLDDRLHHQLYVPVGFAHGFCVVSELADVVYHQTGYYDALLERTIAFDDPDIGIEWPALRSPSRSGTARHPACANSPASCRSPIWRPPEPPNALPPDRLFAPHPLGLGIRCELELIPHLEHLLAKVGARGKLPRVHAVHHQRLGDVIERSAGYSRASHHDYVSGVGVRKREQAEHHLAPHER